MDSLHSDDPDVLLLAPHRPLLLTICMYNHRSAAQQEPVRCRCWGYQEPILQMTHHQHLCLMVWVSDTLLRSGWEGHSYCTPYPRLGIQWHDCLILGHHGPCYHSQGSILWCRIGVVAGVISVVLHWSSIRSGKDHVAGLLLLPLL